MNFTHDNNPPMPDGGIRALETRLGHALPPDYREFLQKHNGGVPEKMALRIENASHAVIITDLFGINRGDTSLYFWMDALDEEMPDGFLMIGIDAGGNAILLDTNQNTIFYWDRMRFFPESTDQENTYRVAPSFDQFLCLLRNFPA